MARSSVFICEQPRQSATPWLWPAPCDRASIARSTATTLAITPSPTGTTRSPDEELYPLLHKHVALLRYPTDHAAAKLAAFHALTSLHPAWAEARDQQSKQQTVRVIMGSWGCLYRLAYMIATAQAAAVRPLTALRAPHALFARMFPDYPDWLDRCASHGVTF